MDKINYTKWNGLGFLEGLCEKHGTKLAYGLECLSKTLLNDSKLKERKFNNNVDVIAFPVLRKSYDFDCTLDLSSIFINKLLNKLLEFTNSDDFKNSCSCDDNCSVSQVTEARLLKEFVETNYGK